MMNDMTKNKDPLNLNAASSAGNWVGISTNTNSMILFGVDLTGQHAWYLCRIGHIACVSPPCSQRDPERPYNLRLNTCNITQIRNPMPIYAFVSLSFSEPGLIPAVIDLNRNITANIGVPVFFVGEKGRGGRKPRHFISVFIPSYRNAPYPDRDNIKGNLIHPYFAASQIARYTGLVGTRLNNYIENRLTPFIAGPNNPAITPANTIYLHWTHNETHQGEPGYSNLDCGYVRIGSTTYY